MKIKTQTNKKRPFPDRTRAIKEKTSKAKTKQWQFTLSLTEEELRLILLKTKYIKSEYKIKRSDVLRKVLLKLADKNFLEDLGFRIYKK